MPHLVADTRIHKGVACGRGARKTGCIQEIYISNFQQTSTQLPETRKHDNFHDFCFRILAKSIAEIWKKEEWKKAIEESVERYDE